MFSPLDSYSPAESWFEAARTTFTAAVGIARDHPCACSGDALTAAIALTAAAALRAALADPEWASGVLSSCRLSAALAARPLPELLRSA